MDNNNNVALSDVERNKELFEYEMTEVILQLKGEFVKLSGKDLNLKTAQLSAPKINIQNNIPEIKVEQAKLDSLGFDTDISCTSCIIPSVEITKNEINFGEVPTMNAVTIESIELNSPQINKVNVEKINIPTIATVDVKMPDISFEAKQIKKLDAIPAVTVQHIAVEDVDTSVNMNITDHDVRLKSIKLNIPETDISLPDIREVSVQKIRVDVPDIGINTEYHSKEINVKPSDFISIPQISGNINSTTVNVNCNVGIPKTEFNAANYVPIDITLEKNNVTDTDIPNINVYSAVSVTKKALDIDYKPISKIASVELPEVTRNSIQIDVPEMFSIASVKNTSINIDKTKINNDYPMIKTVEISPVTLKKTDNISIPEKADFSVEIQSILESIV